MEVELRAYRGGDGQAGRYSITIEFTAAEVREVDAYAAGAMHHMNPQPDLIQPHSSMYIVLTFKHPQIPHKVLTQFKAALAACKNEGTKE